MWELFNNDRLLVDDALYLALRRRRHRRRVCSCLFLYRLHLARVYMSNRSIFFLHRSNDTSLTKNISFIAVASFAA